MEQNKKNVSETSSDDVRQRVLSAAGSLFAEQGLDGTSVRQITSAAKCNVAAVNYYFGGKDKLYVEVFRQRLKLLRDVRIVSINEVMSRGDNVSLEDLLGAFANAFLAPLIDETSGQNLMRLITREMLAHHLPKGMFFEEMAGPVIAALYEAMMKICPSLDPVKAQLSILSLVGQLAHTICAQELLSTVDDTRIPAFDMTRAVEHIVTFSAAGIRAYEKEGSDENV